MDFTIHSIGTVINSRNDVLDDFWGGIVSEIRLDPIYSGSALEGIETFSHLEIVYVFHKAVSNHPRTGASHPRENAGWPKTGIFAQRKKNRPNFIGTAMAKLIKKEGTSIFVMDLDAINGTPVIDIKPVMREFLPRGPVTQPVWADELMQNYWKVPDGARPVRIILNDLLHAIEDHCDFACYYLDRETGEIIFQSERELIDDAGDDQRPLDFGHNDNSGERFIPVDPMESSRGRETMDEFIGTLPDSPIAKELSRTVSMLKSFRRFKDVLHNHPDLEKRWRSFQEGKIKKIAEEWLHHHGIRYEFVSLEDLLK